MGEKQFSVVIKIGRNSQTEVPMILNQYGDNQATLTADMPFTRKNLPTKLDVAVIKEAMEVAAGREGIRPYPLFPIREEVQRAVEMLNKYPETFINRDQEVRVGIKFRSVGTDICTGTWSLRSEKKRK